jgi:hypothetical protein
MHTGKQLGSAIAQAIDLKIASGAAPSKKAIALHFGIKPPSLYDWINGGTIGKEKIPRLLHFFSDVVDAAHWGISLASEQVPNISESRYRHDLQYSEAAYKSHKYVAASIRDGYLPKPSTLTCLDCGASAQVYDHRDYNRPLDVEPVCHACNVKRGPAKPFVHVNDR